MVLFIQLISSMYKVSVSFDAPCSAGLFKFLLGDLVSVRFSTFSVVLEFVRSIESLPFSSIEIKDIL